MVLTKRVSQKLLVTLDEQDALPPFGENDPYCMSLEERQEWKRKIREVLDMKLDIQEELDHVE